MRISDWSSDVCSSDLWRGEERQIANTVFPGSIHLVINGPLYRCTRAQECPSGREGNCVGLRPERIAHKLHHATGMLQEIALHDPAEGRELGIKRSEEQTSELQSLMSISYDVLFLKKKLLLKQLLLNQ